MKLVLFSGMLLLLFPALVSAIVIVEYVPPAQGSANFDSSSSGGGRSNDRCVASIECSFWSECIDGIQTRTCEVSELCGAQPPITNQSCYVPQPTLTLEGVTGNVVVSSTVSKEEELSESLPLSPRKENRQFPFIPVMMFLLVLDVALVTLVVRHFRNN